MQRESEDRYRDLVENIQDLICTHDLQGHLLFVNQASAKVVGYSPADLIGTDMRSFLAPEVRDQFDAYLSAIQRDGQASGLMLVQTKSGEKRIWEYRNTLRTEGPGEPIVRGLAYDITERKKMEESLREAEQRYRRLFEQAPSMYVVTRNEKGVPFIADCNELFLTSIGYTREEVQGKPLADFYAPESRSDLLAGGGYARSLAGEFFIGERQLVRSDGSLIPTLLYTATEVDPSGRLTGTRAMFVDITDRKRSEEALRESERKYKELVDNANSVIIRWNKDGTLTFFNEYAQTFFGYSPDEAVGKHVSILLPERASTGDDLSTLVQDIVNHPDRYVNNINENICRDGRRVWMAWTNRPILDDEGQVVEILAVASDINAQKRVEEALRESEERYRLLFEKGKDAVVVHEVESMRFVDANPAAEALWGYTKSELMNMTPVDLSLEPDKTREALEQAGKPGGAQVPVRWQRKKDGSSIAVEISASQPITWKNRNVLCSIVKDITDRQRAEEKLLSSEKAYRTLAENIPGIVYRVHFDDQPSMEFFNNQVESLTGFLLAELTFGEVCSIDPLILPEDRPKVVELVKEATSQNKAFEIEYRIRDKNGAIRHFLEYGRPILGSVGSPFFIDGVIFDVTERRKVELALKASEESYKGIFDNAAVGIDLVGAGGEIRQVNHSFAQMLGYSVDELLKMNILDITHPEDVESSKYRHQNMVKGKTCAYRFEKRYIRKDGEVFWADVSVFPARGPDGVYESTIGVISDITARKQAEEALRESEQRYRAVVDNVEIGISLLNENMEIVEVNNALKKYFPHVRPGCRQICYEHYNDPPRTEPCLYCPCVLTLQDGEVHEALTETPSGPETRHYHLISSPIKDSIGRVQYVIELTQDITDLKMSEALIRARMNLLEYAVTHCLEDLIQKTLDEVGNLTNSPIGFYHFMSEDEKILSLQAWSTRTVKEFCQAEGRGRHYPVDQAGVWVDCVHERKPVIHNDYSSLPHRRGMPEGHAAMIRELVVPIMRSDRIVAILGIGNKPTLYTEKDIEIVSYLADVAWEIIQGKQAEEARKESEQRYRTLFENSIDGVYSVLRDGTITDANLSFCELFGYTREEMIGKDIRELYLDPADRQRFQVEIEEKGFVKDYEIKFQKRNGTEVDCLLTSSAIFEEDGSTIGYRGIVRDLTGRKALQRQLLQAQKMEAVGTLAGGIAHDFNNILQVVLGYSELVLGDEDLPGYFKADLGKILLAARNGADLVQRLLTFSRKVEANPLNLDLNQRIRQTEKFLERTIPKMIDIQMILADDLALIHADPTQMDQVLMNLSVNARDAMPEGGKIIIETANVVIDEDYARFHLEAKPGPYILLRVSDTGSGMDKETLDHIFEPFYTTKGPGEGTGLGLSMVFGIVKQHRGFINCYSEVGRGTIFTIYLPAVIGGTQSDQPVVISIPQGGTETILLVDDEEFVRDLGKRILERSGYTVLTAANGKEALDLYKREMAKISLVILDVIMPEMGGKQCLEELLRIDPKGRVLIASGYSAEGPTKDALQGGAKGFVSKPFDMGQLLQTVRKVLDEA